MRFLVAMCIVMLWSVSSFALEMGETAHYVVNPSRSSAVIKGGTMDMTVIDPAAVTLRVKYDIKTLIGPQTGSKDKTVSPNYFEELFWENLRKIGHYESGDVKIEYLGLETIMVGNKAWPNCDKLHSWNFVALPQFLNETIFGMFPRGSISNSETVSWHLLHTIPVMGAAMIDLNADVAALKQRIKIGFDYQP